VGRPVVMAAGSGAAEILEDGRDALWFEPGNAVDLAAKLVALLADPELGRRLAASAGRTVAARLSRARLSALEAEVLRELRGAPNPLRRDPVDTLVAALAATRGET